MTDLGIAQIKNHNYNINYSFSLENLVYNELVARGYDVYTGKTPKGEIDFVAEKDGNTVYIQVAYILADDKVIEREFGAFNAVKDNFPKYVISLSEGDFGGAGIIHINMIDFLLGREL